MSSWCMCPGAVSGQGYVNEDVCVCVQGCVSPEECVWPGGCVRGCVCVCVRRVCPGGVCPSACWDTHTHLPLLTE